MAVAIADVSFLDTVGVGVVVTVILRTTGTTVTVGMREVPLRIVVEIVAEAVVSETEVTGVGVLLDGLGVDEL